MTQKSSIFKPYYSLLSCYLLLSFILRIVLINHPITNSKFAIGELFKIFGIGALNDIIVMSIAYVLFVIYFIFISNKKYYSFWGYLTFIALLGLWAYVTFGHTIFNDYGGVLPEIAITFVSIKTALYGLCLFLPTKRLLIRKISYFIVIFLFSFVMVQNTLSEFFFWNEFGVRYNFIAVDYLVYTNEVIGNIMESYPVVPLFITVGILTLIMSIYVFKKTNYILEKPATIKEKLIQVAKYSVLVAGCILILPSLNKNTDKNVFTNELESNGIYKFYHAFNSSELDYFKFYDVVDQSIITANIQKFYPKYNGQNSLKHKIQSDSIEQHKNVVLITMESFNADYLSFYGNKNNLTPFLDSLATKSIFFTQVYATGNRTVRGLEAVTMCILPSPGESVVKRNDNKDKFTTGSVFAKKGYQVKYLYGGNASFDNMGDFFVGNNYDIVDKAEFTPNEITFENIWGVCDEDMSKKAIEVMNAEYKLGKPFFNHIMTVSNHRPFSYPKGAINTADIENDGRKQGVRYTDHALKEFFKNAEKQPWFDNTIFIIVADHCASSAGKTELPLDKYRIPAMIYAPKDIVPQHFDKLMSQIDLMPTALGLLNFNYESKFFGTDVLQPTYKPRAFIATYQDLGYIRDHYLTILGVNKTIKQYSITPQSVQETVIPIKEVKEINKEYANEAISFYQFTAEQLKNKAYNK